MTRFRIACCTMSLWSCLASIGATDDPSGAAPDPAPAVDGRRVRTYTKEWTDDYFNRNRIEYSAYTRLIRDETGAEYEVEVWHGVALGRHENGRKAWEMRYCDGKREGEFESWAENGTRTILAHCKQGELEGAWTQWAPDGRMMFEARYRRGKLDGEMRWWAPDGQLAAQGTYRNGSPWTGEFIELDPSPPRSRHVLRRYDLGKQVAEQDVPGGSANWW